MHTPGPWKYGNWKELDSVDLSGWIDIWATDEDGEETLPFAACKHIDQEANARLIAAAPDLVFQLLAAANYIDALGGDSKTYRAAIAKATGEQ